jgi:L-arabonate dehydrase
MVRISDARMSGTSYRTCVLHTSPKSAIDGPLACVRDGDWIALDVPGRSIHLAVSDEELAHRQAQWKPGPAPPPARQLRNRIFTRHLAPHLVATKV